MKILYGIQCTGNGHLSRSIKIINRLKAQGHNVDIVLSGKEFNKKITYDVKYRFHGFTFYNTPKGGINYLKTAMSFKFFEFLRNINELDVTSYDKVISDFEPVTAWACKMHHKKCYGVSNQYSLLNKNVPKKGKDILGELILKCMAPVDVKIGLHYQKYDSNIFMPIISDEILDKKFIDLGHCTVYLPSFCLRNIVNILVNYPDMIFHVFHGDVKNIYKYKNCLIYPIDKKFFVNSFTNCNSIITNAGFQTSSEALYMSKKLMVIPTKGQYEQECNISALNKLGIFSGYLSDIGCFLKSDKAGINRWKDPTNDIINLILN
jgi:uncharacterized protein (TIGR00661 family)